MFVKQIKRRFHYVHFNHIPFDRSLRRVRFFGKILFSCEKSASKQNHSLSQLLSKHFPFFLGAKKRLNLDVNATKGLRLRHACRGLEGELTMMIMVKNCVTLFA